METRGGGRLFVEGSTLFVRGVLDLRDADSMRELLEGARRSFLSSGELLLDLSDCPGMDAVPAVLLFEYCRELSSRGVSVSRVGASPELERLFETFESYSELSRSSGGSKTRGLRDHFEDIGDGVVRVLDGLRGMTGFATSTVSSLAESVTRPASVRWHMVLYYMEEAGVKAIPIIAVLTWLLGTVLGYQAGYQMEGYGAEKYMPALLAYSITWEIGPMLAAVLVAGRSGSAFAAEIGTMKVRQEVDALEVMGFDVFGYLVTPKMLALLCVMPFLVLLANCSGIIGGLLSGGIFLGMPASVYMEQLGEALIPLDVVWGMIKSFFYAIIIANVGGYMGTKVRGGAAAVGKATTSSVVVSIFLVILVDALLSLLFVRIRPGLDV